ncbi:hypothetical protein V8E36_003839 [Tilletia maclaganii]
MAEVGTGAGLFVVPPAKTSLSGVSAHGVNWSALLDGSRAHCSVILSIVLRISCRLRDIRETTALAPLHSYLTFTSRHVQQQRRHASRVRGFGCEVTKVQRSNNLTTSQANSTFLISRTSGQRALAEYEATGTIKAAGKSSGRRSTADDVIKTWVFNIVRHRPTIYLGEIRHMLSLYLEMHVNDTTVGRCLKKARVSLKVTRAARQRDEERRANYAIMMTRYRSHHLVFADETHFNQRKGLRTHDWAPQDERAAVQGDFTRGGRWTPLPAISADKGLFVPMIVEGSIDKERFLF